MKTANRDIAFLLRSVAAVYLLTGVNRFRRIAYEKAADTVEQLDRELYDVWENGQLDTLSGIGATILKHLDEYFKNPSKNYLQGVIIQIPSTVFDVMRVPGLGPKRAFKLVIELKLENTGAVYKDLLKAAKSGKIASIEGFGEKSEKEIMKALTLYLNRNHDKERMSLSQAVKIAKTIIAYMKLCPYVKQVDTLGSLRRGVATIGDIDLAVLADKKQTKAIVDHFIRYPGVVRVDNKGSEKASIFVTGGWRVDMRVAQEEQYGSMLQYFTGSKAHNIKLREFAIKKGFSLSEYGIKKTHSGNSEKSSVKQFDTEKGFYNHIGLQYIPPELREGADEVELSVKNKIPHLVERVDIRGEFHVHSSYQIEPSHDLGADSYETLCEKAIGLKYDYIGFADHNPSLANHTDEQVVAIMRKRFEHLRALSNKYKRLRIFIGCEVDIVTTGQLALPIEAIEYVDYIIASVHSSFGQGRELQTKRILTALSQPKVKILGHPTARLIGKREEIDVDWSQIFSYCAKKKQIALEINSAYERFDLPDMLIKQARDFGCVFAINTDAHALAAMDTIDQGVTLARRGWLTRQVVINTLPYSIINTWINHRKTR